MFRFLTLFTTWIIALIYYALPTWANIPFTDVSVQDPYYQAVSDLFQAKIITDDGSGLFLPHAEMNRDFFVSLTTEIGCKNCTTPTFEDIIRFRTPPFVDIPHAHPYYYCIAYAKEDRITQGYLTNLSGTMTCEDGNTYTSSPFCASNTITRIEAAAMLLRRANLWNDTLNSQEFPRDEIIEDVTPYWYGYAKKAIQIGIIEKRSDNTIGSEEKIKRGEFAIMASRILEYTQCEPDTSHFKIASRIDIHDQNNTLTDRTIFRESEPFTLVPYTDTGSWTYSWKALHATGDTIHDRETIFSGSTLSVGQWGITMTVWDNDTPVSESQITLVIIPDTQDEDDSHHDLSAALTGRPSVTRVNAPITFTPHVRGGSGTLRYQWDFGDGFRRLVPGIQVHRYNNPGIYKVTLTITEEDS